MNITISMAAKLIGQSEQTVRMLCRHKIIGETINGAKRNMYIVSPGRLSEWLGITADELERRVENA